MTTLTMGTLHNRLKELRLQNGYKQKEIAEVLDVHISTYGKIELGEIGLDITKAQKLAKFYGISTSILIGEIENNSNEAHEPVADYGDKPRNPIRFYIEVDPNADQETLPDFFLKLQKLIKEENNNKK